MMTNERAHQLINQLQTEPTKPSNQELAELRTWMDAQHAEAKAISSEGTKREQAAKALLDLYLESPATANDVQVGDALRGALAALVTQVVWLLDQRGSEWVDALGFKDYPYTSQAISAVGEVTE